MTGRSAFNARLDAVVTAVFLILVTVILFDSLRVWADFLIGTWRAHHPRNAFHPDSNCRRRSCETAAIRARSAARNWRRNRLPPTSCSSRAAPFRRGMATVFRRTHEGQVSTGQVLLKALRHPSWRVFYASLGGFGLFLFGIVDSSFLFLPLGIDLLLVRLTAPPSRAHVLLRRDVRRRLRDGLLHDGLGRAAKAARQGLEGRVSPRRLAYVQGQVRKRGGCGASGCVDDAAGFPVHAGVIVAAALKYPRPKLVGIVAVFRFVRFSIEGWLAIRFGSGILRMAERPVVQWVIFGLVIISIVGSAWSIYGWVRRSKGAAK